MTLEFVGRDILAGIWNLVIAECILRLLCLFAINYFPDTSDCLPTPCSRVDSGNIGKRIERVIIVQT